MRRRSSGIGMPRILDKIVLLLKGQVHSFGELLSMSLLLDKEAAAVPKDAFHQFQLGSQLQPFLDKKGSGYSVMSRLNYCHVLYKVLPLRTA